jgi:hypothetical protein
MDVLQNAGYAATGDQRGRKGGMKEGLSSASVRKSVKLMLYR